MLRLLVEEGEADLSGGRSGRRPIEIAVANQDSAMVRLIAKKDPTASEGHCGAALSFFEKCIAQEDTV
jgi:hypothetical protein